MGDLQATIEFLVELYKFYNVDLFIRGFYQFRLTIKPPKSSHAMQVEICEGHGERGTFNLFPAFVTEDGQTAVSRTFNIYYKDEEVLLKDVFLFRVHLLVDSTKAADCIDKSALEMTVDVHFTDQVVRENNYRLLPQFVTSRTLKFHFSCFNGLHHQVPLLFDYYYFSVLDMVVHANVVSLSLPNWSILKQIKTGWFGKSNTAQRSSTPLFYSTLFGNRLQLGSQLNTDVTLRCICIQFYSDVSLRYAVTNSSSISREHFERASAIHRNLCAILAMAHSKLLMYFEEMMHYLDEKQKIKLGEKLDPADLVEGLCKKLETLQSCEEVFDEMCSDMSLLNNELALLWLQFQESFILNDQIRPVLREQHHNERMMHFSEAFFVHKLPWKTLLNVTDSSFQKHVSMGQCVKSSKYLSMIPPVTIECAEVDGDPASTPIFFEDCYVYKTEDDVLEHKPLSFGILNQAFNDHSPQLAESVSDADLDSKDVWVDVKMSSENNAPTAGVTHTDQDSATGECKVVEKNDEANEENQTDECVLEADKTISSSSGEALDTSTLQTSTSQNDNGTINLEEGMMHSENTAYSEETSNTNSPKTLLQHSIKHFEDNMEETQQGTANSQDTCTSCDTTLESEIRDVGDIVAVIDTTAENQASMSNIQASGVPTEEALKESDGKSYLFSLNEEVKKKDISVVNERNKMNDNFCDYEGLSLYPATNDSTNKSDISETERSSCSLPNDNTTANGGHLNTVEDSRSLKKEGLVAGIEEPTINSNLADEANHVVDRPSTVEKTSKVQYIGSSDSSMEKCNKIVSGIRDGSNSGASFEMEKPGSSNLKQLTPVTEQDAGVKLAQPRSVTGQEIRSKLGQQVPGEDIGSNSELSEKVPDASAENDNESVNNRLCNTPDETTSLIQSQEGFHSEGAVEKPEFYDANRSPFEISSGSSVTKTCSDSTDGSAEKNASARNTAAVNSKKLSNSVFYDDCNKRDSCSNEALGNELVSNSQLNTVRLSSNTSANSISCFCGGNIKKTSSPYKPASESDSSNLLLQKARQDVMSRMNYCGTVYSDSTTNFFVNPYFINPKPDLSMEPVHFVVCVHGLDGNSGDLRLLRCFLEMALPSTKFEFLMSEVNQENTFGTFEKLTDKLVSEILHHMEAYRISPSRLSFIGHSMGNIIIRAALNHPQMEPYIELFHTFLSLSGPHLGMVHHTSSLVSTGMWLLQKWKKSESLLQLSLNDSTDMRDTYIYKLSKKKGLEYFTNVLLVSSVQDHYVPFHSSRIELPKSLRTNSQEYTVYREMMENLLTPLLNQPNRSLVRYSVYHCLPSSTNTFIGRAAHIAMLDSELFIEKLICTSAAKYFQ
ncbi:protein FAM135B-like isoform X3 [Dendronephthya gigantea]|uniref:protein FAM135B-like isoform X3 n=1 Tax=Dendronephthya gigantea TaxID=151771 RepID=UPI00106B3B8E|nr:protein FAM135B-like isoform X3 [Dendronephthya gigantea]